MRCSTDFGIPKEEKARNRSSHRLGGSRLLPDRKGVAMLSRAILDAWQISGILTMMSGAPDAASLSLASGNANNWFGSRTDAARPMLVGDRCCQRTRGPS
jgi:hypothetical protein